MAQSLFRFTDSPLNSTIFWFAKIRGNILVLRRQTIVVSSVVLVLQHSGSDSPPPLTDYPWPGDTSAHPGKMHYNDPCQALGTGTGTKQVLSPAIATLLPWTGIRLRAAV